jgi:hypothetical protein
MIVCKLKDVGTTLGFSEFFEGLQIVIDADQKMVISPL